MKEIFIFIKKPQNDVALGLFGYRNDNIDIFYFLKSRWWVSS